MVLEMGQFISVSYPGSSEMIWGYCERFQNVRIKSSVGLLISEHLLALDFYDLERMGTLLLEAEWNEMEAEWNEMKLQHTQTLPSSYFHFKNSSLTIGLEVKKVCGITQANVVENLYHSQMKKIPKEQGWHYTGYILEFDPQSMGLLDIHR